MTTKRGLYDFTASPGAHGQVVTKSSGPAGRHKRKIREYFTARGKPKNYQYSPEEAREATNFIKAVDRSASGGSSFLQGAASDASDQYGRDLDSQYHLPWNENQALLQSDAQAGMSKDQLFQDLIAGENETELDRNEMDSEALDYWLTDQSSELNSLLGDQEELGGDLHDIGNRGERIDETASLLDYDPEEEAFDSSPDSTGGFAASMSSGKGGKLSPMQKYGAKLIMDTFGEKEQAPMQVASVVPLTPGRALDMSRYSFARPKRERYRNMGLLGRA